MVGSTNTTLTLAGLVQGDIGVSSQGRERERGQQNSQADAHENDEVAF